MKHTDIWYRNRLNKYFNKYFNDYEYTAEFYVDPAVNKWLFIIPELGLKIKLTCYDDGRVIETRELI